MKNTKKTTVSCPLTEEKHKDNMLIRAEIVVWGQCYYTKKGALVKQELLRNKLRVQDSNMRPPGYEPGELPTAPTRDIK